MNFYEIVSTCRLKEKDADSDFSVLYTAETITDPAPKSKAKNLDTYFGSQNSFVGYISSVNYFAYALNYDQIQSDYVKGPNMKLLGQNTTINYKDYLAMNWYYSSI
jgi:hypothetical protein